MAAVPLEPMIHVEATVQGTQVVAKCPDSEVMGLGFRAYASGFLV